MLRRSGTFTRQGSLGSRASGRLKPAGSILGARIRVGRLRAGLTLRELGQMLHRAIQGSRLVVVPDAGHNVMFERPEQFNRLVLDFLTE